MQAERLIARIRGQLELGTPDLEARSLAGEYAALCQRARERLDPAAGHVHDPKLQPGRRIHQQGHRAAVRRPAG